MGSQVVTNPFQSQVNLGPANDPMASALPNPFYDYGTSGVSQVNMQRRPTPYVIPQTAPSADIVDANYMTYADINGQPSIVEMNRKPMPQMPALPGMSIQMAPRVYQQLPVTPPYLTQGIPFPTF
jgi:hypothetical protein